MLSDCIFCRIAREDVPAEVILRSKRLVAFRDINPQAPVHVVIIPVEHISSLNDLLSELGNIGTEDLLEAAAWVATRLGINDTGYRVVINTGKDTGQTVKHLHLHVLGGETLGPMA